MLFASHIAEIKQAPFLTLASWKKIKKCDANALGIRRNSNWSNKN